MLTDAFGRKYPNTDDDSAALRDVTDARDDDPVGGFYATTLGDLIVESLIGRELVSDGPEYPQHWESFDYALLRQASLELRALNVALACSLTTDDPPADEMTVAEISECMRSLARRVSAGAELSKRLRVARWGHPNFGSGEGYAERVKAEPRRVRRKAVRPERLRRLPRARQQGRASRARGTAAREGRCRGHRAGSW